MTVYSECFNAFQGNTVAGAAHNSLGVPRIGTGAVLAVIAGFIILVNITSVPGVLGEIVSNAIGLREAATGGVDAAAPAATSMFFFPDPTMGILAIVNLVAIMMVLPICLRMLRDYRKQLASGVDRPVLNPDDYADLDIDRTAWKPIIQTSE
ncbi:hypothetical protein K1W69_01300 [Hoeflea sp. WL0058]|uniref:Uncharacterized protein n=1 Tax=Flavimaribacter sediminis TaxID=2865987 RepID=A0AAE2ZM30_9HYPH|nr:hypothetical protein [Flavimaribacter sediminis]MBW8635807.1 hypothetical protein [Flavimaribacter sediminis]